MLPVGSIFQKYCIPYHCYVNNTWFYVLIKLDKICAISDLLNCQIDMNCCMANNFFQLNENKTEVIIFDPAPSLTVVGNQLGSLSINHKDCVRNLGVILDMSKFWEAD